MARKPWTEKDDLLLERGWGHQPVPAIACLLGRSVQSLAGRAWRRGFGPSSKSTVTIRYLEKRTGWTRQRIRTAAARAGIYIRRLPARTTGAKMQRFALTLMDADRIVAQLTKDHDVAHLWRSRHGEWGTCGRYLKPKACVTCGRNDRPHYAKGLCRYCYDKKRYVKRAVVRSIGQQLRRHGPL